MRSTDTTLATVEAWLAREQTTAEALLARYREVHPQAIGLEFGPLADDGTPRLRLLFATEPTFEATAGVQDVRLPPAEAVWLGRPTLAHSPPDPRGRHDPLTGGLSVGSETNLTGTLGALAWRASRPYGPYFALTCEHVLRETEGVERAEAIQPAIAHQGDGLTDTIADLTDWGSRHPTNGARPVDCAIARLRPAARGVSPGVLDGTVTSWRPARDVPIGLAVTKYGTMPPFRRTGQIVAVGVYITLEWYGRDELFGPLFRTEPIADTGDSGSLTVAADGSAIGLVMALTSRQVANSTLLCPIEAVQDTLRVRIARRRWR